MASKNLAEQGFEFADVESQNEQIMRDFMQIIVLKVLLSRETQDRKPGGKDIYWHILKATWVEINRRLGYHTL